MSSSELTEVSSLSSAESLETDDEILNPSSRVGNLDQWLKNAKASPSPPPKKREPSPPHEYVLADNPIIAFIVMFRSRFGEAFPRSCPHFGPQDIERGIVESFPDESVEKLLCCLLGLVLNRKKEVEKGHYMRALEEAVQVNAHQWPTAWNGQNPLHGGGNFNNMSPEQRLILFRALILWALNSSDAIQAVIKENYKQQRQEDDRNQPLSVQPWGRDGYKRRLWLIEGRDDTHFRIYRESNPALKNRTWWSVADSIPMAKELADRLQNEGSQASRRLHDQIYAALPRFEAGEEKRKRRDYRLARKAQFLRPEPGFSLYEGRTRGKRVKYTFSDDEDEGSDAMSTRRSARVSGVSTPAEPVGPTFTASGRQVRSRVGGTYGEIMHSGQQAEVDAVRAEENCASEELEDGSMQTRNTRGGSNGKANGRTEHSHRRNSVDEMDDESDATSTGDEWNGGDEDEEDEVDDNLADEDDEDADVSGSSSEADNTNKSLMVSLKVSGPQQQALFAQNGEELRASEPPLDSITLGAWGVETRTHESKLAPMSHTNDEQRPAATASEDAMDVSHNKPRPSARSNSNSAFTPPVNGKLPNGAYDGNASISDVEKIPHPLQPETKLPFSPPKPAFAQITTYSPLTPSSSIAKSKVLSPSAAIQFFETPSTKRSASATTQADDSQRQTADVMSSATAGPEGFAKNDDVTMT